MSIEISYNNNEGKTERPNVIHDNDAKKCITDAGFGALIVHL